LLRAAVARILRRHRLVGHELRCHKLAGHEVGRVGAADVQRHVRRAGAARRVRATGSGIGARRDPAERWDVRGVDVRLAILVAGLLIQLAALLDQRCV